MEEKHPDHDAYLSRICEFINSQPYLEAISTDAFKKARHTQELGISSLSAIALVASYMTNSGLSDSDLNPEWVPSLSEVGGVVSVFREIDSLAEAS